MENRKDQQQQLPAIPTKIIMGWPDFLNIYGILDSELKDLERPQYDSVYLSLAIFLLSVAASFLASLLTVSGSISDRVYFIFAALVVVGSMVGLAFLVVAARSWFRTRSGIRDLAEKIRSRVPPEGVQETDFDIADQPTQEG